MIGLSSEQKIAIILSIKQTGRGRRKLSPVEVSDLLQSCIEAGDTIQVLSKELQLSGDMIGRFLSLRRLSDETRALVDWGSSPTTIAFSSAHAITRLKDAGDQTLLAKAIVEYGLTKEEALQVVQRQGRAGLGIGEAVQRILDLQPSYVRSYIMIGAIRLDDVRAHIGETEPTKRDELLAEIVSDLLGEKSTSSTRLTPSHFTLSLNETQHASLLALRPSFEEVINTRLRDAFRAS